MSDHGYDAHHPSDLAPGVYFVRVTEGAAVATQRVIVD